MTLKNLPTAVLGLATIAILGGCCTSGSCGSVSHSTQPVYASSTLNQGSDCGCGCSSATEAQPSYEYSNAVDSNPTYSTSEVASESPYLIGEPTSSAGTSTPIIVPPSDGATSGFTPRSSTRSNVLPGNFLPEN